MFHLPSHLKVSRKWSPYFAHVSKIKQEIKISVAVKCCWWLCGSVAHVGTVSFSLQSPVQWPGRAVVLWWEGEVWEAGSIVHGPIVQGLLQW